VDIAGTITPDTYYVQWTINPQTPRYITQTYMSGVMRVQLYESSQPDPTNGVWVDTGDGTNINISFSQNSGFTDPDTFTVNQSSIGSAANFSIGNVAVEQDKFYKLVTRINSVNIYGFTGGFSGYTDSMSAETRTPLLAASSISVTYRNQPGDTFTEITDGGFQVKSGTTSYLRVPVSTQNSHWADIDVGGTTSFGGNVFVTGSIDATGNITAFSSSDN